MASKTATIPKQRIGRIGQRRQVVIPREIFEKLNMREGDFVAFAQKEGGVLVKPKRIVDADDYTPDQRRIIDARLKAALQEVKRGNTAGPFNTADEMIASLKRDLKGSGTRTAKPRSR